MKIKKILIIICSIIVVVILWIMLCGYLWSWGPFHTLSNIKFKNLEGNKMEITMDEKETDLKGKKIAFLGSSVTYGSATLGVSFVDYIEQVYGCIVTKEAVSGTTLVTSKENNYIERLKKMDTSKTYDLFVVQLSTNDATMKKPLGSLSNDNNYDTNTIYGAIEYIITYIKETYHCPVVFYSNAYYESNNYKAMVEVYKEISQKHNTGFINMYDDTSFNDITKEQYQLYMADKIHPTKSGYYYWWTPYMAEYILNYMK